MSDRRRLFFLSFLMLFVELALIRWTGENVLYLSYFSNFVLLGSFLGIGIGFLRAKAKVDLFPWAALLLAFYVGFVTLFPVGVDRSGSQLIYFGGPPQGLPLWVVLPLIFAMTACVMTAIAQGVSKTFARFEPLQAYRLDILGSLAGIAAFTILSFLGAPPIAWGVVATALLFVLYLPSPKLLQVVGLAATIVILGKESFDHRLSWSPYYKVLAFPVKPNWVNVVVNQVPHQYITSVAEVRKLPLLYFIPYQHIRNNPLDNVLIVGAGNGIDTAVALQEGAKHIDAVEIDPRIYQLGRQLNPDRPYADPRVTAHINDGRAFLRQTTSSYDLILFALPDSLTLVTGQSSLRLESYLFTIEAMRAARARLRPGGAFGMYNNYREGWLVDRLANELSVTYGHPPCFDSTGETGRFALLLVGTDPSAVSCTPWTPAAANVPPPATDDRPFVYLRERAIPQLYLFTIALILLASLALVRLSAGPLGQMRAYVDLFFMGAAFLLLETKNVVQFALLFGSTWLVNALVFFGILLAVLAAIEFAQRVRVRSLTGWYVALFGALALAWTISPEWLLSLDFGMRLAAAISIAFAPVFLANVIFAQRFRDVGASTVAFGTNLLGAMVGGVLEYSSLILGFRGLLILVAALYALAFAFERVIAMRASPVLRSGDLSGRDANLA
jgi:hypothetical protein